GGAEPGDVIRPEQHDHAIRMPLRGCSRLPRRVAPESVLVPSRRSKIADILELRRERGTGGADVAAEGCSLLAPAWRIRPVHPLPLGVGVRVPEAVDADDTVVIDVSLRAAAEKEEHNENTETEKTSHPVEPYRCRVAPH